MSDFIKQDPTKLIHISNSDFVPMMVLLAANKGFLPLYLPRYILIGGEGYGFWVQERSVLPWLTCVRNPGTSFEMCLAGVVTGVVPTFDLEGDDDSPNLVQRYKYQVVIEGALELVSDLFIQNAYIQPEVVAQIPFQVDFGVSLPEWANGKTESHKLWLKA
jgi:hypothetical protein